MKDLVSVLLGLVILAVITFGTYWVAKNVSYSLFYEDMVIESVKETVKASCLK